MAIEKSDSFYTSVGILALIFWSFSAVFTQRLDNIPTFQILTIIFFFSFVMGMCKLTFYREWYKIKQPWYIWLVGIGGLYGTDVFYIQAFKYAPATHADLINYLWPVLVVLFSSVLPTHRFSLRYLIAALMGFTAVFILIRTDIQNSGFELEYMWGYLFAFLDAVVWTIYVLVVKHYAKMPIEMIGMFSGFGALFGLIMHLTMEQTVVPTAGQWHVLILMGLTTQGLAYYLWAYAAHNGNLRYLSILSYLVPIASVTWLVVFNIATMSLTLFVSALMVSFAALFCSYDVNQLWQPLVNFVHHHRKKIALSNT